MRSGTAAKCGNMDFCIRNCIKIFNAIQHDAEKSAAGDTEREKVSTAAPACKCIPRQADTFADIAK